MHHRDDYPAGNDDMAVDPALLAGRDIGMDFSVKDGWSMYHGDAVPGFPQHPHRGFETLTLARNGFIDHSDSLGATARFGHGDAQWMTAGQGIVHSEMFPLVNRDAGNPTELFQIWLNLPAKNKLVEPHFTMLWSHTIPRLREAGVEVGVIAGDLAGRKAPAPPPSSWAADPQNHVAVWTVVLEPNASWTIPAAARGLNRTLYVFEGETVRVGETTQTQGLGLRLRPEVAATVTNGADRAELLLLQGRPIGEPVAQHGPFVMNSPQELQQAFVDYQRTQFGGWPWKTSGPVHARDEGRFAIHADGRRDTPQA